MCLEFVDHEFDESWLQMQQQIALPPRGVYRIANLMVFSIQLQL